VDDEGKVKRRRVYREAVRVVTVNHEQVKGARSRLTRITFEPRLTRRYRLERVVLLGNVTLCSEGASVEQLAAMPPDQRTVALSQGPLTWLRAPRAAGGRRPECRVFIDDEEWTRRDNLLGASASERAFAVESTAGGGARVRFGDGERGALVPAEAKIRLRYRVGLGVLGNRAALRVQTLLDSHPAVESTFNPLAMRGGSAPEDRSAAKLRAPAALRAMDRAVSLQDIRALALTFDGVQRAQATRGGRRGQVHVTVSGFGGEPLADTGALREFLQVRVAPGVHIEVENARPVPTFLDALLRLHPGADPLAVIAQARLRLGVDQEHGQPPGLLHPDRTDVDQDLSLSDIYRALEGIEGLAASLVRKLYRQAADTTGELLALSPSQRVLSTAVQAGARERLVWAPPHGGSDGVRLFFEEQRDR